MEGQRVKERHIIYSTSSYSIHREWWRRERQKREKEERDREWQRRANEMDRSEDGKMEKSGVKNGDM